MARILIIDDEEDVRIALKQVLERAGYEVSVAADGPEGLDLMKEEGADLVITDVIMPGIDGIAAAKKIRDMYRDTRIIVMSGGGMIAPAPYEPDAISTRSYLASASRAGADRTITKPFDRHELLQVVQKLLEES
ncbi:MAG: response regulator [Gammaproteobacteria bacterium]|jgi:CheY-like chemotaxis protein|nr:response regulator [Gammaproteobacteria bacterium]MDH3846876.1 response regulator [Gammaproteobacteria bacterium]MDH3864829.1 response regulator [Gammaproteobacteria bacterium]MDH3905455.1 response regulator [Gammaproteobacteria bacterium]MDH3953956.1 response regulator [Gammaproteobacteria bacterium]